MGSYEKMSERGDNTLDLGTSVKKPQNALNQPQQFLSEEEKQLAVVTTAFNYSRNFYSFRFLKFRSWLRLFHRIPDTKPPFRSNLFIPKIYELVSTVLPRMIANNLVSDLNQEKNQTTK